MIIPFIMIRNRDPTCPITIDPIPTIIAIEHNINVTIQAQLDPVHKPYATAK